VWQLLLETPVIVDEGFDFELGLAPRDRRDFGRRSRPRQDDAAPAEPGEKKAPIDVAARSRPSDLDRRFGTFAASDGSAKRRRDRSLTAMLRKVGNRSQRVEMCSPYCCALKRETAHPARALLDDAFEVA